jgi:hypothetical protein
VSAALHRATTVDIQRLWDRFHVDGAPCPVGCEAHTALVVYSQRRYSFRCTHCSWRSEEFVVRDGMVCSPLSDTIPPSRPSRDAYDGDEE